MIPWHDQERMTKINSTLSEVLILSWNHITATCPQQQQQVNEISESVQETEMVTGNTGEGAAAATPNTPETLLETLENKLEQLKQKAHTSTQADKERKVP